VRIEDYLRQRADAIDAALAAILAGHRVDVEPRLLEAMEYSLLSPGKRIRPILVIAAAEALGAEAAPLVPFACAVEMVHAYSLIHDDLPAMDDDDLRRGRPTNHKVFGEATAILAGDALLTEAFAVIAADDGGEHPSMDRRLAAVRELAVAAGARGMVGGQTADILAEGVAADLSLVESIHRRKTGALLRASVRIGALLAGADADALKQLSRYGDAIGLAFQVADDLLDEAGDTQATGKSARRDRARGKSTVPAVLGVEATRRMLQELLAKSVDPLARLGPSAEPLRGIASLIVQRAL
jgi:geranylgeranyl diphosphate synthase, type II